MASVDVILWKHQAKKDGTYPLRIRITKSKRVIYKSTGYSLDEKHWDSAKRKVKTGHPNAVRLNNYLLKLLSEMQAKVIDAESKDVTAGELKTRIFNDETDFFSFAESYLEKFNNSRSIGTYRAKLTALNKLKQFTGGYELRFADITYDFLIRYRTYLQSLGNNPNTRTANLKKMRAIYNEASRLGIINSNQNPFTKLKMESNKSVKTKLSSEELDAISNLQYQPGTMIWHCRNIFLLCFNFMGMRIADALTLRKRQLSSGRISYTMRKTDDIKSVLLSAEAKELLSRYNINALSDDDYIFPLVKPRRDNDLHRAISSATAMYNKYLRSIAKDAGITKTISSHVARHSWAQQAKLKNINLGVIQQALGHASARTTEIYMEAFDSSVIDAANELIVKRD